MQFSEVREKYPQYNDLSDEQLAGALHKKYYSDISFDDFSKKVGLSKPEPETSAATYIEPALTIASSVPAEIVGGLSTLWPALTGNPEQAEANLNAMRDMLTYIPKTQEGQAGLQAVGETLEPVGEALQTVQDKFSQSGAQTFETLGLDPAIGAGAGAAIPEAIGMALGVKAVKNAPKAAQATKETASKVFNYQSPVKQELAKQIQAGSTDNRLAKYMVNGAGKIKKDKKAIEAINQGFDKGVVQVAKAASPKDRAKMREMVNIMQRVKNNALEGMEFRPSDVPGKSLVQRVNYVKNVNKQAGSRLDNVAKSLKGKKVDFSQAVDSFVSKLDDMGVEFDTDLNALFQNSSLDGVDSAQRIIKRTIERLKSGGRNGPKSMPDAYDMHILKKFIDENVTYGKAGEGLKGKTANILKELRHDINESLRAASPEYKKVNTRYADTIEALNMLKDEAGRKIDIFGDNADKALGTQLRRLMSNDKGRINMLEAVNALENTSKKYGAKFSDDIKTQILFADELDAVFKPVARTSLAGETRKAVRSGAEAATGQKTIPGVALEAGEALINKARGVNEEGAFKAIRELLK